LYLVVLLMYGSLLDLLLYVASAPKSTNPNDSMDNLVNLHSQPEPFLDVQPCDSYPKMEVVDWPQ
jgi:hypothetical protein